MWAPPGAEFQSGLVAASSGSGHGRGRVLPHGAELHENTVLFQTQSWLTTSSMSQPVGKEKGGLGDISFPFQGSLGNCTHHSPFCWPEFHTHDLASFKGVREIRLLFSEAMIAGILLQLQSCLTLCDPMDSSPPGSSVHGIL